MFDISFGELLVVVTGAGLLLGRREIALGSKLFGNGIGRIIGTLQGMKIKYDNKTKGTKLQSLHREVRQGINDVSTIGYDLSSLSLNNTIRPLNNNNINIHNHANTISSSSTTTSTTLHSSIIYPTNISINENEINRLAHLILVDQKLNNNSNRNSNDGVDVIVSTISESILADSYAIKMNTSHNNNNNNNNNSNNNDDNDNKNDK